MLKIIGVFVVLGLAAFGVGQGMLASYGPGAGAQAKVNAQPAQQAARATAPQAVSLSADDAGHFVTDVKVNGIFIKGLVDTGATSIAIPGEVARTIGINPAPGDYTTRIITANGETKAARVRLNEVRIGAIVLRDVEGVVVPQGLSTTLVGMSFISRVSFEMRGKTLTLRQ